MEKNIYSSELKWAVVKGKSEAILTLTERKTHKKILVKSDDENLKTLWFSFFFRFGCANYSMQRNGAINSQAKYLGTEHPMNASRMLSPF